MTVNTKLVIGELSKDVLQKMKSASDAPLSVHHDPPVPPPSHGAKLVGGQSTVAPGRITASSSY